MHTITNNILKVLPVTHSRFQHWHAELVLILIPKWNMGHDCRLRKRSESMHWVNQGCISWSISWTEQLESIWLPITMQIHCIVPSIVSITFSQSNCCGEPWTNEYLSFGSLWSSLKFQDVNNYDKKIIFEQNRETWNLHELTYYESHSRAVTYSSTPSMYSLEASIATTYSSTHLTHRSPYSLAPSLWSWPTNLTKVLTYINM